MRKGERKGMSVQIKGKCKYCGKEYAKGYMLRHLSSCKERMAKLDMETGSKKCGYFELVIEGKYETAYWLVIEMCEDATLKDLDDFLRDIWLECCGHLSSFEINGTSYDVFPSEDFFWGEPSKSMNYKLKAVLEKGMRISYEYDFGSTTDLIIRVHDYRMGYRKKEKVTILSRNNPLEFVCDECHEKEATFICTNCMYSGGGFLCDDCAENHECGEDFQLPVCNSPRMGVCGYEGSSKYPDQFVPDCDQ